MVVKELIRGLKEEANMIAMADVDGSKMSRITRLLLASMIYSQSCYFDMQLCISINDGFNSKLSPVLNLDGR